MLVGYGRGADIRDTARLILEVGKMEQGALKGRILSVTIFLKVRFLTAWKSIIYVVIELV